MRTHRVSPKMPDQLRRGLWDFASQINRVVWLLVVVVGSVHANVTTLTRTSDHRDVSEPFAMALIGVALLLLVWLSRRFVRD